jgi:hypothetical protein
MKNEKKPSHIDARNLNKTKVVEQKETATEQKKEKGKKQNRKKQKKALQIVLGKKQQTKVVIRKK